MSPRRVPTRRLNVLSCAGGALSLALFVPGVFADHHDVAVTTNDFALVANWLDAGVDLHDVSPVAGVVPGLSGPFLLRGYL
jgi:hypothetical protein